MCPDYILYCARIDIGAANLNQVIGSSNHTPGKQTYGLPPTGLGLKPDDVAGAVPQSRHFPTAEIGQTQLLLLTGLDGPVGPWLENFRDKLRLQNVHSGARRTIEPPGTHFGRTGVVETARPPALFDAGSGCWDARSRLSGMKGQADGALGKIDTIGPRGFDQPKGVGGSK